MFINKLSELKKEKKIASFYTDESNTSKFAVGFVIDYNDDYFIIEMISPQGLYDGIILKETSSIFRINTDGMYENKIMNLSKYYKTTSSDIVFKENDLIYELLSLAKIKNHIVSLELLNSGFNDIQGYVEIIDNYSCIIKQITDYGELDGVGIVKFSDITEISCNSGDEIVLEILANLKIQDLMIT